MLLLNFRIGTFITNGSVLFYFSYIQRYIRMLHYMNEFLYNNLIRSDRETNIEYK